jgi:hypothetical protein
MITKNFTNKHSLHRIAVVLQIPLLCRVCRQDQGNIQSLVFCRGCKHSFHRSCWPRSGDHAPDASRYSYCQGFTDLDIHIWWSHLHTSKVGDEELLRKLVNDRTHRWIGVPEFIGDEELKPQLLMYSALTKQFTNVDTTTIQRMPKRRFPRLVSFFGDTGMGKSTIIKNLIRHLTFSEKFEVPVIGTASETENSTSGGVHVYPDPETFAHERPIVYAGTYILNDSTVV